MTIWSVEVTDGDLISRVHPEPDEYSEPWGRAIINGVICFAIIGLVIWGWR
jgi:hypothetical protein